MYRSRRSNPVLPTYHFKIKSNMEKDYKIWLARDEAEYDEDSSNKRGDIHLFYDTPQPVFSNEKRLLCWQEK